MASIYGYMFLLAGMSIMLGLAGVDSQASGILHGFGIGIDNTNVTGVSSLSTDIDLNPFNGTMLAILLGLTGFAIASLALRFDLGASLKVGATTSFFTLMLTELRAIMAVADSSSMGGVIQLIAIVIYLPIAIGSGIAAFNWIGGNN